MVKEPTAILLSDVKIRDLLKKVCYFKCKTTENNWQVFKEHQNPIQNKQQKKKYRFS